MRRVRSSSRVTSDTTAIARPPPACTALATRARPTSSRAASTTVALRRAHARASASPIPPDAPVITTTCCSALMERGSTRSLGAQVRRFHELEDDLGGFQVGRQALVQHCLEDPVVVRELQDVELFGLELAQRG